MGSESDDAPDREQSREAFSADIKAKLEQAQASGKSPDEIKELATAYARAYRHRQIPQITTKVRSWWVGFRRFVIVGALALGFAVGLALYVEHRYAAPLCEHYAFQHGLAYRGIEYPIIGNGTTTTSSGRCMFYNATGHQSTVLLRNLDKNQGAALLISIALQIDLITPFAFILIALIAVKVLKIK